MNLTKISKARPHKRFKVHRIVNGVPACGSGLQRYGDDGIPHSFCFQETLEEVDCLKCSRLQKKEEKHGAPTPTPALPG